MITRTCNRCEREKPIEAFTTDRRNRDGRAGRCRDCQSAVKAERRSRDPERYNVVQRAWRARNPEKIREGFQRWKERRRHRRSERLAFCAEAFDRSRKGQRIAGIIDVNLTRLAVMARTGAESLREGVLRLEFSRTDCERTVWVMERERDEAIRRLEKQTRVPMGARRVKRGREEP